MVGILHTEKELEKKTSKREKVMCECVGNRKSKINTILQLKNISLSFLLKDQMPQTWQLICSTESPLCSRTDYWSVVAYQQSLASCSKAVKYHSFWALHSPQAPSCSRLICNYTHRKTALVKCLLGLHSQRLSNQVDFLCNMNPCCLCVYFMIIFIYVIQYYLSIGTSAASPPELDNVYLMNTLSIHSCFLQMSYQVMMEFLLVALQTC